MAVRSSTTSPVPRRHLTMAANLAPALIAAVLWWAWPGQSARADQSEDSKAVVLEVIEGIINAGDLSLADDYIHPDLDQHASPAIPDGLDGFKAHYGKIFKRFATYRYEVHRISGDGEMVGVQGRLRGVTKGNNAIDFWIGDFFRLEGGKVIEFWRVRQIVESEDY